MDHSCLMTGLKFLETFRDTVGSADTVTQHDTAEGGWTKFDTFCSASRLALHYAAVCSADGSFETQHFMGRRAQQAEIIS